MAKDVKINGVTYDSVPYIDVPKPDGSGDARFYDCTGSKEVTQNGTVDVAGLASVNVNIPIQEFATKSELTAVENKIPTGRLANKNTVSETDLTTDLQNKISDISGLSTSITNIRDNNTKQLFNKYDAILLNAYPTSATSLSGESVGFRTVVVPIVGGQKVTVHRDLMLGRFAVFQFVEPYGYGATLKNYVTNNSASVITIDTDANASHIGIFFYNQNVDGTDTSVITTFLDSLMVEYGEWYTGYEGYYSPIGLDMANVRFELDKTLYVGDNVLGTSVALGTGWSGSISNGFTHASGNSGTLEISTSCVGGQIYLIEFDVSASSTVENSLMVQLGTQEPVDTYTSQTHRVATFVAEQNAQLKFIADSTYNKTITNIKIRAIGKGSNAVTLPNYSNIYTDSTHRNGSGFYNVALSENGLARNLMGSRNMAIGFGSLANLVSGTRNVGIGTFSLTQMVDGDHNVAIGSDTGYRLSKPDDNIMIGYSVLAEQDTANTKENVAIGSYAMHINKSGASGNVCLGYYAGRMATNDNVYIGKKSGYYIKGVKNVAIGDNAIGKVYVGGSYNTVIGADSGIKQGSSSADTNITSSIAIGHGVEVEKSHQCIIGDSEMETTMVTGDFIVRGTDGVRRQIVFNSDGTCSWIRAN